MPDKVDEATASMIKNLEEKTGKSMADWVAIVKAAGDLKHGQVVTMLKEKHDLGHGYANLVAHAAKGAVGEGAPAGDDLVAAQYAGDKAGLRAIYDKLVKEIAKFGKDVEISPKKTYVSLRRSKQFGAVSTDDEDANRYWHQPEGHRREGAAGSVWLVQRDGVASRPRRIRGGRRQRTGRLVEAGVRGGVIRSDVIHERRFRLLRNHPSTAAPAFQGRQRCPARPTASAKRLSRSRRERRCRRRRRGSSRSRKRSRRLPASGGASCRGRVRRRRPSGTTGRRA